MAVSLVPQEVDWSWIPDAPDLTAFPSSVMYVGDYSSEAYVPADATLLTINTSGDTDQWVFNITEFGFGELDTADGLPYTEYYQNEVDTWNWALVTLGHPGIGLPGNAYKNFVNDL